MPPATSASFRSWLKQSTNIKLLSDAAVTRITYEGITDYESLSDFDKDIIDSLPRSCSRALIAVVEDLPNGIAAEPAVVEGNISTISVHRLVVAANAVRYYRDVNRTPDAVCMHYNNVLSDFKTDYEAYCMLKKQDHPDIPSQRQG